MATGTRDFTSVLNAHWQQAPSRAEVKVMVAGEFDFQGRLYNYARGDEIIELRGNRGSGPPVYIALAAVQAIMFVPVED